VYVVHEYAACLLVALVAAAVLFAGYSSFLAVKAGYRVGERLLRK
jgi:hypothetical protein